MKYLIIILTLAMSTQVAVAQTGMDKFEIQVDGLGCPFCAYGLEKKFKEFKGIENVAIDIETGDFSFDYPAEKALTLDKVRSQVEAAGYTPVTARVTRSTGDVENLNEDGSSEGKAMATSTAEIEVAGNCNMCKARIEKAALGVTNVVEASWDKDSKILEISYADVPSIIPDVEKAVAKAGHDTKNFKALESTYQELPACCHYERLSQ